MVTLDKNRTATGHQVFAEGWLQDGKAWGRPVDVLVMPDGSLLVSDDTANAIYRIYLQPVTNPGYRITNANDRQMVQIAYAMDTKTPPGQAHATKRQNASFDIFNKSSGVLAHSPSTQWLLGHLGSWRPGPFVM